MASPRSPFGGIPRNWKRYRADTRPRELDRSVPPSGGSLEIGNFLGIFHNHLSLIRVPPSGGSLEIGNEKEHPGMNLGVLVVPPSGGSLEIGNQRPCS